jgi:excisionase family DNA binding protein
MPGRKVYCNVIEGLVYEDRYLYHLSKVITGNKSCQTCIVLDLERARSSLKAKTGGASSISSDVKISKNMNISKDMKISKNTEASKKSKKSRRAKRRSQTGLPQVGKGETNQVYTTQELSKILGKAERTLQEWAGKGKMKAVRVGAAWRFPKEEVDRLLEGKVETQEVPQPEEKTKTSGSQGPQFLPENQGEAEKGI